MPTNLIFEVYPDGFQLCKCYTILSGCSCINLFILAFFLHSGTVPKELLLKAKLHGFSDEQVGQALSCNEKAARELRLTYDIRPWVKQVRITAVLLKEFRLTEVKKKKKTLTA